MSKETPNSAKQNPGATLTLTSLVQKYDGSSFVNVTIPVNATLNQVLKALDGAFGGIVSPTTKTSQITLYDGSALSCITIPPNSTLNDIIALILTNICINRTSINNGGSVISADGAQINVPYDALVGVFANGEVVTSNTGATGTVVSHTGNNLVLTTVTGFFLDENTLTGGTSGATALVNGVATTFSHNLPEKDAGHTLPSLVDVVPPVIPVEGSLVQPLNPSIDSMPFNPTDRTLGGIVEGLKTKFTFEDLNVNQRASYEYLRNTILGILDDFTSTKGALTTSGVSLTITIAKSNYYISGRRLFVASTNKTLSATSDNYIDVSFSGAYTVTAVPVGNPPPALAANNQRLYKLTTNGAGVTVTSDLVNIYPISNKYLGDASILARNIFDGVVSTSKMDDILVQPAGTFSMADLIINKKGRISSAISLLNKTGLSDKKLLWWDAGSSQFVPITKVGDLLPAGGVNNSIMVFSTGAGDFFTATLADVLEANNIESIYKGSILVLSATILSLNTTPIDLVAAPGASKALVFVSAIGKVTFNTTAYDTNTELQIITESNKQQATDIALLKSTTANRETKFKDYGTYDHATLTNIAENKKLQLFVPGGNPLNGDSQIKIYYKWYVQSL